MLTSRLLTGRRRWLLAGLACLALLAAFVRTEVAIWNRDMAAG